MKPNLSLVNYTILMVVYKFNGVFNGYNMESLFFIYNIDKAGYCC